jgi:L-lactate dehydrogenase complex protein LldG
MSSQAGSRSKILASIRQSLQGGRHLPPQPQLTPPTPIVVQPALAEQFAAELTQLSGTCISLPAAEVAGWMVKLIKDRGAGEIVAWQDADLPVTGLLDAMRAAGIQIIDSRLPHQEPGRSAALAQLERVTIGLTGADAAFADTGTLALTSGPGRPRLASLSVRTHVALLDPRRLYPSWAAWLAAEGEGAVDLLVGSSNLTLITGPSRTADIEMTLTVGVHGPGELIVVLVG